MKLLVSNDVVIMQSFKKVEQCHFLNLKPYMCQKKKVHKKTFLQLCQEDVKEFLDQMAIPRINKGWEFMLPYDEDFMKKHPDVVQRQSMLWKGIQAKYVLWKHCIEISKIYFTGIKRLYVNLSIESYILDQHVLKDICRLPLLTCL